MRRLLPSLLLLLGCSASETEPLQSCVPGEVRACACAGTTVTGVQACADDGARYEACTGCPASMDAGTIDAGPVDAGATTCAPATCATEGPDSVCVDDACVDLTALGCAWGGGPREQDPLRLGALFPRTEAISELVPDLTEAAGYAIDTWNEAGGVRGRPLGLIVCDTAATPELGEAGARTLARLGVHGVAGPALSVVSAAVGLRAPIEDQLFISPSATSPTFRDDLVLPELVLSMSMPEDAPLFPLAHLPVVRSATAGAVIVADRAIEALLDTRLGRIEDQVSGRRFARVQVPLTASPEEVTARAEGLAAAPDVLVLLALRPLAGWVQALQVRFPHTSIIVLDAALDTELRNLVRSQLGLQPRFGVVGARPPGGVVLTALAERFGREPGLYAPQAYDAVAVLAALHAAAEPGSGGLELVRAMPRLMSGAPTPLTAAGLSAARARIEAGESVHLVGTGGTLQIDPQRGAPLNPVLLWRFSTAMARLDVAGTFDPAARVWNFR